MRLSCASQPPLENASAVDLLAENCRKREPTNQPEPLQFVQLVTEFWETSGSPAVSCQLLIQCRNMSGRNCAQSSHRLLSAQISTAPPGLAQCIDSDFGPSFSKVHYSTGMDTIPDQSTRFACRAFLGQHTPPGLQEASPAQYTAGQSPDTNF